MQIIEFFPIPVGVVELSEELTEDELNFIKNCINDTRRNIGGNLTSINHNVLEDKKLQNFKKVLTSHINEYFKHIFEPSAGVELYITQSWLNFSNNGDSHHSHHHSNSLLSGVFYVDTCKGDELTFEKGDYLLGNIEIKSDKQTKWTSDIWGCPAIKNHLIIFPSKIKHSVPPRPQGQKGIRISLAFNTWFRGEVGKSISLNLLKC